MPAASVSATMVSATSTRPGSGRVQRGAASPSSLITAKGARPSLPRRTLRSSSRSTSCCAGMTGSGPSTSARWPGGDYHSMRPESSRSAQCCGAGRAAAAGPEMEVGVLGAIVRAEAARSARSGRPAGEACRARACTRAASRIAASREASRSSRVEAGSGSAIVTTALVKRDDGDHHQQLQQREAALAGTAHCQEPMSASLPSPPAWPSAP